MKISTILTSYNRPVLIKHALQSVFEQSGPAEVIIVDDMSDEDVFGAVKSIPCPADFVVKWKVMQGQKPTMQERLRTNRLSNCLNLALTAVEGDLIVYLVDDDYFLPGWFDAIRNVFVSTNVQLAFGREYVSADMSRRKTKDECLAENGQCRWFESVDDPFGVLDHNQIVHRRSLLEGMTQPWWPISDSYRSGPDAYFFRSLRKIAQFVPIDAPCCVKRFHDTNYQRIYTQ